MANSTKNNEKPTLNILTGISGAGKSAICTELFSYYPERVGRFVTSTTRDPRTDEIHGKDYYFHSLENFKSLIDQSLGDKPNKPLFEYEEVYPGRYYGCERQSLEKVLATGKIAVGTTDIKGALKFLGKLPGFADTSSVNVNVIFIDLPKDEAIQRIHKDNEEGKRKDTDKDIADRIAAMEWEMEQRVHFANIVTNSNGRLHLAFNKVANMILHPHH